MSVQAETNDKTEAETIRAFQSALFLADSVRAHAVSIARADYEDALSKANKAFSLAKAKADADSALVKQKAAEDFDAFYAKK